MRWRNTPDRYGSAAVGLHWLVALLVAGLFGLGLYMRDLSYYDPLYRVLPQWHKELGVILLALVLIRLLWRRFNPAIAKLSTHRRHERVLAGSVHVLLYVLPVGLAVSGWLIVSTDGRPMVLWDGFIAVPALQLPVEQQEELAGTVHWWLALTIVGLAILHGGAALKHHFIDRDRTLLRMLGR